MRPTGSLIGALFLLAASPGLAAEVCQYAGATSQSGRVAVRTEVSEASGLVTVAVAVRLDASPWRLWDVQVLAEEISSWRGGELRSVAVNNRYIVNGRPRRQQWDVFTRGPDGLVASRVQAKTLADFRKRHPAFAVHWDMARFGQPWLADYPAAQPERRPDLDLGRAALPLQPRTPLALAFHWSRWLPAAERTVPVFLPGWKRDAALDASVQPAGPDGRWRITLRHPALDRAQPSWADAVVSPDHQLRRLTFDIHAAAGDGQGWVDLVSCQGHVSPLAANGRGER